VGGEDRIDTESGLLSYQLAGALPIDLDFKQALLGVHSEDERLAGMIEFLEAILPKLRKAQRQREKAGGNGHVP
jgi:Lon protease-like protein